MHSGIKLYDVGVFFGLSKPSESKHGGMSLPLNFFFHTVGMIWVPFVAKWKVEHSKVDFVLPVTILQAMSFHSNYICFEITHCLLYSFLS